MSRIGYIRVSTEEQNTARQDSLMQELGVDKIFIDKMSGKNTNRPELAKMMEYVREGDTVIVESYSRLSRSVFDLLTLTDQFSQKGVTFISKKENIDTTTSAGKLMMNIFASIYQFEREVMKERQSEGVREAKKRGVYKGRKPIDYDQKKFDELYPLWKSEKITAKRMMEELQLKPNTFYRLVQKCGF